MNTFGRIFKISLFGESHGMSVGVLIDGIPVGLLVDEDLIKSDLKRRNPKDFFETPRKEADEIIIESGVYNGVTVGSPVLIRVLNKSFESDSYRNYHNHHRPSHADYVLKEKYKGLHNLPGTGHFSGRLSIGLVIAGSFAKMILKDIDIKTEFSKVGTLTDFSKLDEYLQEIKNANESVGAILTTTISNLDVGLGEPFFDTVEGMISHILYSIPSVKGVSFGIGFSGVELLGSEYVDVFIDETGRTKTNHSGGINRGITNGNYLIINTFIRPISSFKKQIQTFDFEKKKMEMLENKGNHDTFIGERIKVIIENSIMVALADLFLLNKVGKWQIH